jgi:hypothetical protein
MIDGITYIIDAVREALGDDTWYILTDSQHVSEGAAKPFDWVVLKSKKHDVMIISQDKSGQYGCINDGMIQVLHLEDHAALLRELKHLYKKSKRTKYDKKTGK